MKKGFVPEKVLGGGYMSGVAILFMVIGFGLPLGGLIVTLVINAKNNKN